LAELQQRARRLHEADTQIRIGAELLQAVDREEKRLLAPPRGPLGKFLHPFVVGFRALRARRRLKRLIGDTMENSAVAYDYACRRMDAQRRVVEFQLYTGLFSGWHLLHVPLFIMMFITAIVHVIAVHIY